MTSMNFSTGNTSKLLDVLAGLYERGHRSVRIGCNEGSGFVYIGPILKIDFEKINQRSQDGGDHLITLAEDRVRRMEGKLFMAETDRSRTNYEKYLMIARRKLASTRDMVTNWKPYQDRKVISVIPSTVDPDMIIIVSGRDGWKQYCSENRNVPVPEQSLREIVGAIYEGIVKELVAAYRAKACMSPGERRDVSAKIKILEKLIIKDYYGFLDDPEAIVKACRKRARMEEEG